jgi:hypothetical protein
MEYSYLASRSEVGNPFFVPETVDDRLRAKSEKALKNNWLNKNNFAMEGPLCGSCLKNHPGPGSSRRNRPCRKQCEIHSFPVALPLAAGFKVPPRDNYLEKRFSKAGPAKRKECYEKRTYQKRRHHRTR